MNECIIENTGSNNALLVELQTIHWERYVNYAQVKVTVKEGKVSMVYIEQSIKPI